MNQLEILLVEDNDDDARLAIRELKKHNLANNLLRVHDGAEALDYLFGTGQYEGRNVQETPKVMLLDLKMPKVDGLEVLREMRKDKRTKQIPVVVLTSSNEERDITESYNLGVNSYIVKPVDFVKFAESIREIGYYWLVLNKLNDN